jgi:RHS repeat-associated protein
VRVSVRNSGSGADLEDGRTLLMTITSGSGNLMNRAKVLWARLDPWRWKSRREPAPPVSLSVRSAVVNASGDVVRNSIYTPELSLMAETAESTASTPPVAYEYVWFAGQPVAQVDVATNTTHWTFTDHLGTPILQTNASATVDWRAEYEPYGTVYAFRAGASSHQPLRFPGQEYDSAAGEREYNIFRWYREGWGRYTQGDPLGSSAADPYAYVNGDPIAMIDQYGRYTHMPGGPYHSPFPTRCQPEDSCSILSWKYDEITKMLESHEEGRLTHKEDDDVHEIEILSFYEALNRCAALIRKNCRRQSGECDNCKKANAPTRIAVAGLLIWEILEVCSRLPETVPGW